MKIGLIDVDGHNFPNLALMRISAYHKAHGDTVEWWWSDFVHYDIVYMSKIFSDTYTADVPEPLNADRIIKGGTGYCIHLGDDGKERFDKSKNTELPPDIEHCFPDYSLYPQFNFAVSMTSRGCPRGCAFCHVAAKEGRCAVKVADVSDFWCGQKEIKVLDPNITACPEKRDLMRQYRETGAYIDFTQGIDIRLVNEADIADLNAMRISARTSGAPGAGGRAVALKSRKHRRRTIPSGAARSWTRQAPCTSTMWRTGSGNTPATH